MYTLRNRLIVLAAVGILAVVGILMNSRKANAQCGAPVGRQNPIKTDCNVL